ncbi:NfeD family protein [Tessaracoccus rhinocerotis]|uniref:NfeD family protein n=1 Tax=Tessaracoccus rhinocerotis TaxID=1689449 RepID=A0A553K2N3_9ACTN|nr:NfeD family protein [Tessaracoccus rhinocerotis]TRY18955.1 NfeD family protein [Tessaracoccus rhinocerotis]
MDDFLAWFRDFAWAGWGILAVGLAALEMLTMDLTLLMLASGALAGGLTALVVPGLWWLQVIVAVVVAVLTLLLLRPTLLDRVRNAPGYRSSLESLVGSSGRATAQIDARGGEAKVSGQVWDARSFDPDVTIAEGHEIEVYGLDGVTLIVYPVRPQGQLGSN